MSIAMIAILITSESAGKPEHSMRSAESGSVGGRASVWSAEACFRFAVICPMRTIVTVLDTTKRRHDRLVHG